jgi:phospholipid/cholesterol/gamma-HCH transport system substrate-binding protein
MSDWTNAAKVGVMTVVLGVALYFGYQFISREAGTGGGYKVYAYLPDVTGVAPRSRVMVSGVQVGVVDKISLENGRARVDVKMKPEHILYDDAAIGKRASSLIGEYFIVLSPGTEGKEQIPDGGQIKHLLDEPSLETIQAQIADILTDVKGVTGALNKTVGSDQGQERMEAILKNLADATDQLAGLIRENRRAVNQTVNNVNQMTAETRPELLAIMQNIRETTQAVREMMARAPPGAEGKPGELRESVERVNRASQNLESLLKHADNVAARIDRGEGTVGRLTKDETLINEVEEVVEGVGDFVGGIGRLQTIVELRADYNFLANTVKSYVGLRLQPAEDKYYLIEIVNDPRGLTTIEQIDVQTTNPNDPPSYREVRQVTENSFRFSFQFAKRMGFFTGRFGIKESTGGIGIDLHLLEDRFELRQDFFGFGEQIIPRWRVALSYEFVRKLWLLGGVDNILSDDRRDYFFGLQLRFNDEDLKSILPFAPTGAVAGG